MCGEKPFLLPSTPDLAGSPPRVRGKAENSGSTGRATGITPACAGKSGMSSPRRLLLRDHPRVCGEKVCLIPCISDTWGSPPRVRGKGADCPADRDPDRITPACAGKRLFQLHCIYLCRDHPRVCGEKSKCSLTFPKSLGSPPRVRGKARQILCNSSLFGITPACAGKSLRKEEARETGLGSPPRVRGKVVFCPYVLLSLGITPACAGKRQCFPPSGASLRDHPRVCGEKLRF